MARVRKRERGNREIWENLFPILVRMRMRRRKRHSLPVAGRVGVSRVYVGFGVHLCKARGRDAKITIREKIGEKEELERIVFTRNSFDPGQRQFITRGFLPSI